MNSKRPGNKESEAAKEPAEAVPAYEGGSTRYYARRLGDVQPEESSKIWLISFTDIMALMLTFFVMLYAMSEPEEESWSDVSSSLQAELSRYYGERDLRGPIEEVNLARIDFDEALNIRYLDALLESILKENEYLASARIFIQPGQLVISMPQELLFEPGDASVKNEGARALYALGGSLTRIKNKIEIIGHADPRPLEESGRNYETNWDLSFARAASVAGILNSVGYERNIDIRGLGSGRYEDLQGIQDEDARLDLARRVDIIVKDHDGRKTELGFLTDAP